MTDKVPGGPPKPPEDDPNASTPPESGAAGSGPPPTPEGGPPPTGGVTGAPPPPGGTPPSGPPPGSQSSGSAGPTEPPSGDSERSAAMWAHLAAAIITILCVCAPLAFVPPLIFFLMKKDESRFVAFHSLQSLFLFGATSVVNVLLGMAGMIGLFIFTAPLGMIINLGAGIYGVIVAMQANKGEWAEYVVVGELAKNQLQKS